MRRKAAKLSKQYQTAEPEGANPDADNRSAFDIMEASFSKLEQNLINKDNENFQRLFNEKQVAIGNFAKEVAEREWELMGPIDRKKFLFPGYKIPRREGSEEPRRRRAAGRDPRVRARTAPGGRRAGWPPPPGRLPTEPRKRRWR